MSDDNLSPDEVRASLRSYFTDHPGLDETRRLRDGDPDIGEPGFDPKRWQSLASELGLAAMGAPDRVDGLGLGLEHVLAAVEECGASLYPGPARAAALFSWALGLVDEPGEQLLTWAGRVIGADAIPAVAQDHGTDHTDLTLSLDGHLSGRAHNVTHPAAADVLVAVAQTPRGPCPVVADLSLERVEEGTVTRVPVPSVDISGQVGDLELHGVPAVKLCDPGDADALRRFGDVGKLLVAAEQVVGAEGCLHATVEYAKVRTQFGQVIGGYQAIQHRCATTAVDIASARSLLVAAARAIDRGSADHGLSLLAKAEASEVFRSAADGLIQVSGGIGFTWEHDAHLFFRRARSTAVLGGTPEELRDRAVSEGCLDLLLPVSP